MPTLETVAVSVRVGARATPSPGVCFEAVLVGLATNALGTRRKSPIGTIITGFPRPAITDAGGRASLQLHCAAALSPWTGYACALAGRALPGGIDRSRTPSLPSCSPSRPKARGPGRLTLVYRSQTTPSPSPSRADGTWWAGKPRPPPRLPCTRCRPAATAASQLA